MSSSEPSTLSFPARNQQQPFFAQIVVAVFAVCCGIVLWSHLLFPFAENMFGENGLLENLQQGLIAVAGVGFATTFFSNARLPKVRALILVALCVTFLLRETDIPDSVQVAWLTFWIDEAGKKILLATTWLGVIFYVIGCCPTSKIVAMIRRNLALDSTFQLLAGAATVLLVGWLFDRGFLDIGDAGKALVIEESSEVIGYALMATSAWQLLRRSHWPMIVSEPAPREATYRKAA